MADRIIKVLLVEDDVDDYVLIRHLLSEVKGTDYMLDWAQSYEQALEKMASTENHVCLVDYRLGSHDGLEILEGIKQLKVHAPVIFVTGWEDYEIDLKAMRSGATDYLVKSQLTGPLLDRSIRYAMERSHSEQRLKRAYDEMELRVQERTAELTAANGALQRSSEDLRLFAYSIAHDLKNPVFAIHGLVKRLAEHCKDSLDEKGNEYCKRILAGSEQIVALIEQIYAYISAKECPLTIEDISLKDILQSVRDEFSAQLKARDIEWRQPENEPEIRADRLAMIRIFRNLVENALKYGGKGLRKIQIEYKEGEHCCEICVRDDGAGLQGPDDGKIFGLFTRSTNSSGVQGTGLGLAIVKELARQHYGEVWTKGTDGSGAAFFVSIAKTL